MHLAKHTVVADFTAVKMKSDACVERAIVYLWRIAGGVAPSEILTTNCVSRVTGYSLIMSHKCIFGDTGAISWNSARNELILVSFLNRCLSNKDAGTFGPAHHSNRKAG